jgi:uroporphyrinogen-III synthase
VSLAGVRVALLEARRSGELADLIRRYGGEPIGVPAVREERIPSGAEVAALLDALDARSVGDPPVLVFSTGVGVEALFAEAHALGREDALRRSLGRALLACRGPKPVAVLQRLGFSAQVRAAEPYTTETLLEALAPIDLASRLVVIFHHGEPNPPLSEALARRARRVEELLLYAWRMPDDLEPLRRLIGEISDGRFGAVLFTSQVQAHHLLAVAKEMGRADPLRQALRERTVVAAVGPTCARALTDLGVAPHVVPDRPKMGAAVAALSSYLEPRTKG